MLIQTDENPTGLGYYMRDERASGIPIGTTNSCLFETDTYTCSHCSAVVLLNKDRVRPRYRCTGCSHLICDPCAAIKSAGAACVTIDELVHEMVAGRAIESPYLPGAIASGEEAVRQAESPSIILP